MREHCNILLIRCHSVRVVSASMDAEGEALELSGKLKLCYSFFMILDINFVQVFEHIHR